MEDEIWKTRDGREIPVGELGEEHAKNILRMLIRKRRERQMERLNALVSKLDDFPPEEFERPDNHVILADLRRRHGDAVRVERFSVAGMGGGNVYVNGEKIGWFGGI